MNAEEVEAYVCRQCGEPYEDELEAATCCTGRPKEETWWQCDKCGGFYDDKEEAEECCVDAPDAHPDSNESDEEKKEE